MPKKTSIKRGLLSRTLTTAKLSTRLGLSAAKRMLNKELSPSENAVEVVTQLAQEFDSMKGLIMKFGQMASTLGAHLPEEARAALAKLQSEGTAMPFDAVRDLIESELGQPIETAFEAFEEKAFAAASIGQVHRAQVNGQTVAVKVQYPDIEKLIRMDLNVVTGLISAFTLGSALDGKSLAKELSTHILEECDYLNEAANQMRIRTHCCNLTGKHIGTQHIPAVIPSHTTRRILTSEFVDAMSFDTFKKTQNQDVKNKAALTIFSHSMAAIFTHCYFNGDPHPGNYLFHTDGSVTFLDFGCIKKFQGDLIHNWKRMATGVLEENKQESLLATEALGVIGNKKSFDFDFHWKILNHIYTPYRSTEPFRYTKEYNSKTNELMLWGNKNRFSASMPPDMLFINRLQWGMAALLSDLNAQAIWSEPFQRVVYGASSPLFD